MKKSENQEELFTIEKIVAMLKYLPVEKQNEILVHIESVFQEHLQFLQEQQDSEESAEVSDEIMYILLEREKEFQQDKSKGVRWTELSMELQEKYGFGV